MTNKWVRSIELTANIAVAVTAVLLSIVLIKTYILPSHTPIGLNSSTVSNAGSAASSEQGGRVGEKVNLPDVDWAKSGQTLLLVLSSTCHYCEEDAPFYRRLIKESDIRRIALLPQPVSAARKYLESLRLTVDEVRRVRLDEIGVIGTPTILIVDSTGIVTGRWLGVLSQDQETDVLSQVQASRANQ